VKAGRLIPVVDKWAAAKASATLRGVLCWGAAAPRPTVLGTTIGGSGKFLCAVIGL